ncbi:TAXI family TRAP transporter solute-binding subunit [Sporosarcina sp. USHLN248]|uniref:TAXI family TRAP transporter solute-binding subunit n=1 Tax=Sporosarcina sp. USHLN248 TaxID=3081300 RepID=UPI003017642C
MLLNKYIKVILFGCLIIFILSACSDVSGEGDAGTNGSDSHKLLLGTSSQGGTYYVWGGGWADIMAKSITDVDIAVEVTGGPNSNMQLIQSGDMEIGFVTAWLGGEGYNGVGWTNQKHDKIRSLFAMYPSVMHMYALKGKGIESIHDFNGKHVSTGAPGSTSAEAGTALLDALDIKPKKISGLPTSTSVDGLRDGTIDAGFAVTGVPGPFMMDLETSHEVQHIGLSNKDMETLLEKYPYWNEMVIPKGTYKHQDEDTKLVAFWNLAIASSDLSEDLVYDLVKATFEKNKELQSVDPTAKDTIAENIKYSTVPLHPGALKYYREVGIEIPDELIPPESK